MAFLSMKRITRPLNVLNKSSGQSNIETGQQQCLVRYRAESAVYSHGGWSQQAYRACNLKTIRNERRRKPARSMTERAYQERGQNESLHIQRSRSPLQVWRPSIRLVLDMACIPGRRFTVD